MSQHYEWTHTSERAYVITPFELFLQNPANLLLNLENGNWDTAIFAGETIIYADSAEELMEWLKNAAESTQLLINQETSEAQATYMVSITGGLEQPSFQSFTNPNDALWTYLRYADDLSNDAKEHGDRIDLLKIDGDVTTVIASTEYDPEDTAE